MNARQINLGEWGIWLLSILLGLILGCGENGLFEPDRTPPEAEPVEGLTALQFPTHNGLAWTYREVASGESHTLTVEGLRYEKGRTLRQLSNSNLESPTDFYAANAWYLRLNGYFFRAFPVPISATYFEKTPDAYREISFDAFLAGFDPPTFHQQHFPPRTLWVFPLTTGHSWVVFETAVPPKAKAVRTVVAEGQTVRVPQGNYSNAYLVEETFEVQGEEIANPVARYWLVPDVGVVKYAYQAPDGTWRTYELTALSQ